MAVKAELHSNQKSQARKIIFYALPIQDFNYVYAYADLPILDNESQESYINTPIYHRMENSSLNDTPVNTFESGEKNNQKLN